MRIGLSATSGGALVSSLHSISHHLYNYVCWKYCVLLLQCSAFIYTWRDDGRPAKLQINISGFCAGEVPVTPASDHRRTAKKLAEAGRWAEAVQVAQERGTLDDALLLRATDGLADQVML